MFFRGIMLVIPLTGDASTRRFFRVTFSPLPAHSSWILMLYPPGEKEAMDRFIRTNECLREAGIGVPAVVQTRVSKNYLLLEDCGDELLQNIVTSAPAHKIIELYKKAINELLLIQTKLRWENTPECPAGELAFDEEIFLRELNFFLTQTLEGYFRRKIARDDRSAFEKFFLEVCRRTLSQPWVFCHRDYHSRNLLVQDERIRLVDFQDARWGPYTYDLVSLINDPYVRLTPEMRKKLMTHYFARRPKFLDGISEKNFQRDCDLMTIQRILKAAGTFGYMSVKQLNDAYLPYLPAAFKRVRLVLRRYPELTGLQRLLDKYIPVSGSSGRSKITGH